MRTTKQMNNQPLMGSMAQPAGMDVLAAVSHGLDFNPRPRRR
jgi:hypothetical protein